MVNEKKITSVNKRRDITNLIVLALIIFLANYIGSFYFKRFDLTSEKRYTLAESTKNLLAGLEDEVYLKVYLNGDFNPAFTRLRNEAKEMLDEFRAYSNKHVQYEFITPGEGLTGEEAVNIERQLYEKGLVPEEITMRGKDKTTQNRIWPGAIVSYHNKEAVWQIFSRQSPGIDLENSVNNSVEELEYSLTNTIRKLMRTRKAEVTFLQGHAELDTLQQYGFMKALSEYYVVNRTNITPGRELSSLNGSDALIISKPDSAFTDKEIYVIDQYIMKGGKVLWLIDPVYTNLDSLGRKGYSMGINRPLNIEDMLYKYGVRLNPVLIQDIQCSFLKVNTGFQKGEPKWELLPWVYSPLVLPDVDHPIVKNLDLIKFDFASTLDTIKSAKGIHKTILLKSSKYTRTQPAPARIHLAITRMKLKETQFINSYQPVACLLEGEFRSFVENRLPSVLLNDTNFKHIDHGKKTKMIVVADGDIARNEVLRSSGQIYPLGYDMNTRQTFANKN
ncbi:MAG: gliding motility-associated ABC transporter substrate-binding protein GldG, partial [Bacteroidia bacterium]|nr:gliding motility-associated ABC transporter substrate-binding protein GldG [Bacteroidia bacterium]